MTPSHRAVLRAKPAAQVQLRLHLSSRVCMTGRVTGATLILSISCSYILVQAVLRIRRMAQERLRFSALASLANGGCQLAGEIANDGLQLVLLHVTGGAGNWWTRAHRQMSCLLPPSTRSAPFLSGVWAL